MKVRKTDEFLTDLEHQFEWYAVNAGSSIADQYLNTVAATCRLLGQHPHLGPPAGLEKPRLRQWRFFVVFRPFRKHILFYEVTEDDVVIRRVMHGHRDLLRRLTEPPEAS